MTHTIHPEARHRVRKKSSVPDRAACQQQFSGQKQENAVKETTTSSGHMITHLLTEISRAERENNWQHIVGGDRTLYPNINVPGLATQSIGTYYFSINTQVIIQNRALSLARYLGLSADNHLDGQNGCQ